MLNVLSLGPCCGKKRKRPCQAIPFSQLHLTDISWANTEGFQSKLDSLRHQGVSLAEGVSCFDIYRSLEASGLSPPASGYDVIVAHGINYGTFLSDGMLNYEESPAREQYQHLDRGAQQRTVMEAILGQDPGATVVLIHNEYHSRYHVTSSSYNVCRFRLFNPLKLRMQMGADNRSQPAPLVATVCSSDYRQVVRFLTLTTSGEEQLDVRAMVRSTLCAHGRVLGLAAGRLDLWTWIVSGPDMISSLPLSVPGIKRTTSLQTPGKRGKLIGRACRSYLSFVSEDETDSPESDASGRISLARVATWTASKSPCWRGDAKANE